jgi:iron complex outermembrane receptor protein
MKTARFLIVTSLNALLAIGAVRAQVSPAGPAMLEGKVLTASGTPAQGTRVTILELKRRTTAADDGSFHFENVPSGSYLLEAESPRYGRALQRVSAGAGTTPVELRLDVGVLHEEVTVTASAEARTASEIAQPVDILEGQELQRQIQPSLGETLAKQPGVTSTFFGQGASRPIIRGLGGDRIRILEGGIGAGDVSDTSPDHAVTVNTLMTDRIEVVRGPATLLYGSSAIGGVVNAIDNRIPNYLPDSFLTGMLDLGIGSVAEERRGALSLGGRLGQFAWHGDVSKLKTDDYEIPGFARNPPEEGEEPGIVPNSAVESSGASGGLSWIGDAGYIGASYSGWNSVYGSPAEEEVTLDMKQRRVDVQGEITRPFAIFRGAKVRWGRNEYRHFEIEGGEIGTRFLDNGWEGRLELPHQALGPLTGAFGVQFRHRDLEAIGEERFIPPTTTDSNAFFLFEEIPVGTVRLQFGGRYEHQDTDAEEGEVRNRKFNGYSGSAGLVWLPSSEWSLGVSVARTTKIPSAQELFANGPHIGTNAFEIGDPNLDKELSTGLDVTLRRLVGRVTGTVSFFSNSFDGFIFERFTGEEEDELQVIRYTQLDARFIGGEAHVDVELLHREPHHLALELGADYVRAELSDSDEPLPRIPPLRYSAGLRYTGERFFGAAEVRLVEEQDRISDFETPTDGYTMLDASIGYRLIFGGVVTDLLLRGTNLTDEEARNHVSFLKDVAPLPGRNVAFGIRTTF